MGDEQDNARHYESLLAETHWLGQLAKQLVHPDDREDLVQDVLLATLQSGDSPDHPRGWLATVARNHAQRRRAKERNRISREQAVSRAEGDVPSTADAVESFATHRTVVNAVMELDEPYRTAVLLRFWEDLLPREVARRTKVPLETARTRIKRGVDRLRSKLDQHAGERRAWVAPLMQIGSVREAMATPSKVLTGALVVKGMLVVTAAAALILGMVAISDVGGGGTIPGDTSETASMAVAGAAPRGRGSEERQGDSPRVVLPSVVGHGSVLARVQYEDGTPAAEVGVYIRIQAGIELGIDLRTGVDGIVEFSDLVAGDYRLLLDRGGEQTIAVGSGEQSNCELEIPRGVTVRGRVVTMEKKPVAGARVYAFQEQHHDLMVLLANADEQGEFVLRDVASGLKLYARAEGWQPTSRRRRSYVTGLLGETIELDLELGARGHTLRGHVLDPNGRPAARAWVGIAVDEDSSKSIDGLKEVRPDDGNGMLDREAFFVRADENGRFSTNEVAWGDVAVLARGAGTQEALVGGTRVRVNKGVANRVVVHLHPGATIHGTVHDLQGKPYEGVSLHCEFRGNPELGELEGDLGPFLADRTSVTGADGSYRFVGLFEAEHGLSWVLPEGTQRLEKLKVLAGQEVRADLELQRTWQLRVRVQNREGSPLSGWAVMVGEGSLAYRLVDKIRTGADGDRVATGLLEESYVLSVHAPDSERNRPVRRYPSFVKHVSRGEADLVVTVSSPMSVIRGRLLDQEGALIQRSMVKLIYTQTGFSEGGIVWTDLDGHFEIERLPAGEYQLEIHPVGHTKFLIDLSLDSGEVRELGVLVPPGGKSGR